MRYGPVRLRSPKAPAGPRNVAGSVPPCCRQTRDSWRPKRWRVPQQNGRWQESQSSERDSNSFRELAGDTLVNFSGEAGPFVFGDPVEVEHVLLAPIAHHFEARKDSQVIDVTDPVKRVQILLEVNDGRGAVRELQVNEHDVDTVRLELVYAGLQCRRKIVDPNPTHGIGGAGFPDHQNRVFWYDIGGEPLQHLSGGLARNPAIDNRDRRGRIPPGEDLLQTMGVGEIRRPGRQPGRRRSADRDDP